MRLELEVIDLQDSSLNVDINVKVLQEMSCNFTEIEDNKLFDSICRIKVCILRYYSYVKRLKS